MARLEVCPEDMERFMDEGVRNELVALCREVGFDHVALDLEGYVTGKMNRSVLETEDRDT